MSLAINTLSFGEAVPSGSMPAQFALVCEAVSDFRVRIRLSNIGVTDVRMLPTGISPDGQLTNALFRVRESNGKEARYLGVFHDLTDPEETDYFLLKRGKSIEAVVNLSSFYEIALGATYTVDAELVVIFYPSDHFDVSRTPQYSHLKSNAVRMPIRRKNAKSG